MSRPVAAVRRALTERAGRAYVAGWRLEDALAVCRRATARGFAVTLAFWDEGLPPEAVYDEGVRAAQRLGEEELDAALAVKAPALGFRHELVAALAQECARACVPLVFDSHAHADAEPTLALAHAVAAGGIDAGCTLPARWERSEDDARRAAVRDLRIRVIKGQWREPGWPDPVAAGRAAAAAAFLGVVDAALASPLVGVATHDADLARVALVQLRALGVPAELELLLGLPRRRCLAVADELGAPVRLYVPYGAAYVPYEPADARRRTRVAWWLIRDAWHG
jgi:proline dehydrogenase